MNMKIINVKPCEKNLNVSSEIQIFANSRDNYVNILIKHGNKPQDIYKVLKEGNVCLSLKEAKELRDVLDEIFPETNTYYTVSDNSVFKVTKEKRECFKRKIATFEENEDAVEYCNEKNGSLA
jgi:hypothetical protein